MTPVEIELEHLFDLPEHPKVLGTSPHQVVPDELDPGDASLPLYDSKAIVDIGRLVVTLLSGVVTVETSEADGGNETGEVVQEGVEVR